VHEQIYYTTAADTARPDRRSRHRGPTLRPWADTARGPTPRPTPRPETAAADTAAPTAARRERDKNEIRNEQKYNKKGKNNRDDQMLDAEL
jgi:hypothetical protein